MKYFIQLIPFILLIAGCHARNERCNVVIDKEGLPYMFELNIGQEHDFTLDNKQYTIRLKNIVLQTEPYRGPDFQNIYCCGKVIIELNGREHSLLHRPYERPFVTEDLRLYVEAIEGWESGATLYDDTSLKSQVRIAVRPAGEPWLTETILWPLPGYRWRASSYNNTSSGLVPLGKLYYHHGEDYGLIPNLIDVFSPFDGEVVESPLPDGDGDSNTLTIQRQDGLCAVICHMNIETIPERLIPGATVYRGEVVGKTGCTWGGKQAQINDPHVHIEFYYRNIPVASYPIMYEAYRTAFPEEALAVAGGYRFCNAGDSITLDATRSLGEKYQWILSEGTTLCDSVITITYPEPGLFTEILTTTRGSEVSRDFQQVRVYARDDSPGNARGWLYHYPIRGLQNGMPVKLMCRIIGAKPEYRVDFGDGTSEKTTRAELTHIYRNKGRYIVTCRAEDYRRHPVILKTEIIVE